MSNISNNEAEVVVKTLVEDALPNVDTSIGSTVRDLIIRPASVVYAKLANIVDTLLAKLFTPSEEATRYMKDNFLISTPEARPVEGSVIVYMTKAYKYRIPAGYYFECNGYYYETNQAFRFVEGTGSEVGQLPINKDTAGPGYYVIIPVVGSSVDAVTVTDGTEMSTPLASFSFTKVLAYGNIYARSSNFEEVQTKEQIKNALSIRGTYSPKSITALLVNSFDILSTAVIGRDSKLMTRDTHNILGVHTGGMADVIIKDVYSANYDTITVTSIADGKGNYLFDIPVSESIPYLVKSVYNQTDSSVVLGSLPFSQVYGSRSTLTALEAFGTKYSSITVIVNTSTFEPQGTERKLTVEVYSSPQVNKIQAYLNDHEYKNVFCDLLTKQAIPYFTYVTLLTRNTLDIKPSDLSNISTATADYINSLGVGESLIIDKLISEVRSKTGFTVAIDVITSTMTDMDGNEVQANATKHQCNTTCLLLQDNATFYCRAADVSVIIEGGGLCQS